MKSTDHMDWNKLLAFNRYDASRCKCEDVQIDDPRTRSPFQRDYDRILFSDYFRRLGRKTQVHPLNDNDHIHMRLLHSLEVASVGRSLGELVGDELISKRVDSKIEFPVVFQAYDGSRLIPTEETITRHHIGEIVSAACLSHDLGNPPFGHAGEEVIGNWFEDQRDLLLHGKIDDEYRFDLLAFDGNAMSFRILTKLAQHNHEGGMKLTLPTLGASLKYPWTSKYFTKTSSDKKKFSSFRTERDPLCGLCDSLGLKKLHDEVYTRHPLAYLSEAADDVCNMLIDIEDAIELNILEKSFLYDKIKEIDKIKNDTSALKNDIDSCYKIKNKDYMNCIDYRKGNLLIRSILLNYIMNEIKDVFLHYYDNIMKGTLMPFGMGGSEIKSKSLIELSENHMVTHHIYNIYKNSRNIIHNHRKTIERELGSNTIFSNILLHFMKAIIDLKEDRNTFIAKKIISMCRFNFDIAKLKQASYHDSFIYALDYIVGMTDHYAREVNSTLTGTTR